MPRKSAVADVGRPVSLVEILDDPEKYLFTQVMMATEEVVQYAHPDNPQMHDDDDIPEHARSLLMAGWQEVGVTLSITTRYLTGGHGRSAGALMNLGQPQEYFDDQWQLWLKDPDRKEISDRAKARFCPDFWRTCPVWITEISPTDQLAMMVRLNNEDASGSPDRRKMAALLSRLPKQQVELAGWEPGQAKAFASAYLVRAPQFEPEPAKPDLSGYDFDPGLKS